MMPLEQFGFKIFRLREVKESDEFLLYNIENKRYNQFNKKRVVEILIDELQEKGINFKEFAINELGIKFNNSFTVFNLLNNWIQEEKKLIDNLGYKPVEELIYKDENKIYFNLYKKEKILISKNKKGDFPYIKELILNLVGNNKDEYEYFIKWLAWQIQNPLKRLPTSIILKGEQGTGKTKFCELILKNIFGNNFCEIGQADINKEYNDFILGKQLIVANEVIHNDNKFLVPDKLKNFVTDEYLSINRKFKDTIYIKNYAQWIFVTNNDIPLKIEKGDRRYSVFKSKKLKNGRELISNLKSNLSMELDHFVYYLKTVNVERKDVDTPIFNNAKQDIIKLSQNSVEEFIEYVEEIGGIDCFAMNFNISNNDLFIHTKNGASIPTDLFYDLYRKYCLHNGINHTFTRKNFTHNLKSLGFESGFARIEDKVKRVILLDKSMEVIEYDLE